jgi:hypothetical protein
MRPEEKPQDEIVRANVSRTVSESPTFASLYTNDTQLQITPWDVRLIFAVISQPATKDRPEVQVQTVGEVRMSPQHAKRIAQILVRQLARYESQFGVIPQPPD